jgi:hypothetical protein
MAQYNGLGGYGPQNQNQERIMRGNGWSSGDYFGSPMQQQRPQNAPSYQPGLQNNINYRQGDCSKYINC